VTAAELLAAAADAGLTVTAGEDGTLRIRGPRTAGLLARQLLARKDEVLHELALETLRDVLGGIDVIADGATAEEPWTDMTRWPPGSIGAAANSGDFWD
jgi:hypothetical protein